MRSLMRMSALLLLMGGWVSGPAHAQDLLIKFDRVLNTVDVDATRADIADVVQQLFSQAGAPRTDVDEAVQGRVTMRLRGVTRDSALATALSKVDAGYEVENGIYFIRNNRDSKPNRRGDPYARGDGDANPTIRLEDAPAAFRKHVDMIAEDRPIGEIVRSLARTAGVTIGIDRSIPGDVSLDVMAKDEALWTVLQHMANAAHLKLDVLGSQEAIFRPTPSFTAYYRGHRIGNSSRETFHCRSCRFAELKRGWKFCPMCGERIYR